MSATCTYCDRLAVASALVTRGDSPPKPEQHATIADTRRLQIIRVCAAHKGRLP